MSKTYDENVRKAIALANGVKNNISDVEKYGINTQQLDQLITIANETAEKSTEVDNLRKIVAEKSSSAHQSLENLTSAMRDIKKVIKTNYEQPQWLKFGIEDKR